jgi:hypothetical protein
MQRLYLSVYAFKIYTYRPVIYECHVHHGSKKAVLDPVRFVELLNLFEEGLVEGLSFVAASRLVEARLVALFERG